jgi:integrase
MFLSDVLSQLLAERAVRPITAAQYQRSITKLQEFLGRPPTVADLDYATINGYLIWLEKTKCLSAVSVRNHRIGIICLWNYCVHPLGLVPQYAHRRIRCPRIEHKPVMAWSIPDVGKLLEAAAQVPGTLKNGLPAAVLLECWIRLGAETGLRPSDLRQLTWSQIDLNRRTLSLSQSKTGQPITCGFSGKTCQALRRLARLRFDRVFPIEKSGIWKWEQKLYRLAAILNGFARQHRQGLGTLRKTHATEVYREHGLAAASEALGHRSGTRVVQDHYLDSRSRRTYQIRLG